MNCKQFNSVSLEEVLLSLGHLPAIQKEKEAWFLNPFASESQASFKLDKNKNQWFLFSEFIGGNNIDFVKKYFNFSISEALNWASEQNFSSFHNQNNFYQSSYEITEVSELKNWNLKKYLNERGLSKKVYPFVNEVKFMINKKKLYAIGFKNNSDGWELRNSFYKGSILKKDISLIQNDSCKVNVFEGFVDGLSFIEMQERLNDDILILNSVALLPKAIPFLGKYSEINLYFDNDIAGKNGTLELQHVFPTAKDCSKLYSDNFKDLNEFLINKSSKL